MRIGLPEFLVAISATAVFQLILGSIEGFSSGWKNGITAVLAVAAFAASGIIRARFVSGDRQAEMPSILSNNKTLGRLEISDVKISEAPEGSYISGNRGWFSTIVRGVEVRGRNGKY